MAVHRTLLLALVLVAPAFVPGAAEAGPPPKAPAPTAPAKPHPKPSAGAHALVHRTALMSPPPKRLKPSVSVGSPTEGHLLNGAHLTEQPYLRIVPTYVNGDARWGLESLVGLIDRSARNVRKQFADAVLSVGHLSRQGGGEIERHASHESGRDADIGFYIENHAQKPIYSDHFVAFLGDGTAPSWPGARFDDARNWALVSSLVGDGHAHITHIFVATPIRQRLLEYAAKVGAAQNIRVRASELMAQPRGSLPHDDHFHVRIACPGGMEGCIELPKPHHHHVDAPSKLVAHHAAGHAPAPVAPPPHHAAASKPIEKPRQQEEEKQADALVPTLGPSIPGLDSAVIPAPLAMPKPKTAPKMEAPTPPMPPIDDPDGVLEKN